MKMGCTAEERATVSGGGIACQKCHLNNARMSDPVTGHTQKESQKVSQAGQSNQVKATCTSMLLFGRLQSKYFFFSAPPSATKSTNCVSWAVEAKSPSLLADLPQVFVIF